MKFFYTLFICLLTVAANANIIIVTNISDNATTPPSGSLREAVAIANPGDTIRFKESLIASGSETILLTAEISFSKSLVFKGLYNSTDTLYIDGGNTNRHFNISNAGNVSLDSLVLVNGNVTGNGGAISFTDSDNLFVSNCIIRDNTASFGGGISSASSFTSSVKVTNSTISGNTAFSEKGGGIYSYSPSSSSSSSSSVEVTNSTISENTATRYGGGIYSNSSNSSSVKVTNSMISGNTVAGYIISGGGIYSKGFSSSSVEVINSTIIGNTAIGSGSGSGGIYSKNSSTSSPTSSIEITSSIIWTEASGGTNIDNNGYDITSNGYNIFSDDPDGYTSLDFINVSETDLNLQPLANNGGSTQTMLPGCGSVAINKGTPTDRSNAQNGAITDSRRDIGAAENLNVTTTSSFSVSECTSYTVPSGNLTITSPNSQTINDTIPNACGADSVMTITVTFIGYQTHTVINNNDLGSGSLRQIIADACPGDTILFDAITNGDTIKLTTGDIAFSKPLVIIGNGQGQTVIDGNNTNRHFNITNAGNVTLDSLVLVNGNVTGDGGSISIVDSDTLFVNNCSVQDNKASDNGGGISLSSSTTSSLLSSYSTIIINNSTISGNEASLGGGGIYSYSEADLASSFSSVKVTNTTISGNVAGNGGGGILSQSQTLNSPASENSSTSVEVNNSTIFNNSASSGAGFTSIAFGSYSSSSTVNVTSSIIWSSPSGGSNIFSNSPINSHGYNIFSDAPNGYDTSLDSINVLETDLNLQPLANNGGSTPTMLPGCGSVAINKGNPTDGSDAQNGAITDGKRDVGAAEGFSTSTRTVMNSDDLGSGSLRRVIADACPGDTILFDASTNGNDILLTTGDIAFSKPLVIIGNGQGQTVIDGNNTNRHFNITNAGNVTLDSLVLVNGNANGYGGSIYFENSDTLFVNSSTISENNAADAYGCGGGIYSVSINSSTVNVTNSTISGNTATGYNSYAYGGGIYSISTSTSTLFSSTVKVTNSTINGNTADGSSASGGGIYSDSQGASSVKVTNSTISGNTAAFAGGIYSSSYSTNTFSSVKVTNSTISGNAGGGIYSSDLVEITSSIVWTEASGGTNIYNYSYITSLGYNIFSDAPNGYNTSLDSINVSAVSLNLQPLANNGGTTQTMLPGCGSIAINGGTPTDRSNAQNGTIIDSRRDIGAAENLNVTTTSSFSVSECTSYTVPSGNLTITGPISQTINDTIPNACGADSVMTITVNFGGTRTVMNSDDDGANSLRQIIADACPGDTILFDPSTNGNDILLTTGDIAFSKSLVIIGNGQGQTVIDGNNSSRHFNITNAGNVSLDSLVLMNGNVTGDGGSISFTDSDTLFVSNCSVQDNRASAYGGGISSSSSSTSYVEIMNSTISGNTAASGYGGGISSSSPSSSSVKVTNSTIFGNHAGGYGGGISSSGTTYPSTSSVKVMNSTISGNSAGSVYGGGVFSSAPSSSVEVISSIIWTDPSGGDNITNNGTASISSYGYNVFSDAPNGYNTSSDFINASSIDLNLQSLANNGGSTQTMLPLCGSVAINKGKPTDGSDAQNGAITDGKRDIGAAENFSILPTTSSFSVTECTSYTVPSGAQVITGPTTQTINDTIPNACGADSVMTITVTFIPNQTHTVMNNNDLGSGSLRQIIADACSGDTILFDAGTNGNDILLTSGEIAFSKELVFIGNGSSNTIIDGNNNSRIFNISSVDSVIIQYLTIQKGNTLLNGGGILCYNTSKLSLNYVTLNNNTANSNGGGVYSNNNTSSLVELKNSTVVNNSATSGGGMFSVAKGASYIDLYNSTIVNNINGIVCRSILTTESVINVKSSIIALNGTNNVSNNRTPTINSLGYNVFSDASLNGSIASDQLSATALTLNLGTLQNNGGNAITILPGCGSVAINKGNPTDGSDAQNGAITDGKRDVGAAEGFSTSTRTVMNSDDLGSGSLRRVIANACPGDTILFDASTNGTDILLTSGDIAFSKPLVIIGNGQGQTVIDGNNTNRHFNISNTGNVTLDSLVLVNGNAASGNGGSISFIDSDTLFVNNSTISGNTTNANGGGIYSSSYTSSTVNVTNSTISGNTAGGNGGGIFSFSYSSSSSVEVTNSTISGNTAGGGNGGGIFSFSYSSSSSVDVTSSIIWTEASGGTNIDNNGEPITSHGYNIFSDDPNGYTSLDFINVSETDLNLQPLANNGGSTPTMLPGCGSVAINKGNPTDGSDAQNGAITDGKRDVGAAEGFSGIRTVMNSEDDGSGSLRQIIANACPGDTILFDASTNGNTIKLTSGDIAFSKPLVIIGNGQGQTVIDGNNTSRHFNITNAGNVTLDSLVLVNGKTSGEGGSISFIDSDTLFVNNCIVRDNKAARAGGIYSYSPSSTVMVKNSTITGNTTSLSEASNGGGIFSSGSSGPSLVKIENTTISDNSSQDYGGGIYSVSTVSSAVELENSTVSGNSTIEYGGGIYSTSYSASSTSSSVSVKNSTVSGNKVVENGGGIYSYSASGTSSVEVTNSTISGNTAASGGGVYSSSYSSSVDVTSSIVWTGASGGTNIYNNGNDITSHGYNIFSDAPSGYDNSLDLINISETALNLQPLANNGGSTQTMLPYCGSVAINKGALTDNSDAQNGAITDSRRDVGAAENLNVTTILPTSFTVNECSSYTVPSGTQTITGPTTQIVNDILPNVCGGDSILTITVTFIDNEDPVITSCPADITINTDAGLCTSTESIGMATATDNCSVTITNDAPTPFPSGATTVIWTATDASGNTATCSQEVTVEDHEDPVISCPADITINTDAGLCTSTENIGTATATDNCSTPTITSDAPTVFPSGATTVTWTATDVVGNTTTCTQIVTVVDNENPTINCPSDITVYGENNCDFVLTDYTSLATAADNCTAVPTITQSPATGTVVNNTGNHTVTLTATDLAGNSSTCTFDVIVMDTIAPVVNCLADQSEVLDENCQFVLPDYSLVTNSTDNCDDNLTITQLPTAGTVYDKEQDLPVTLTFEDAVGNVTTCSFMVDINKSEINPKCLDDIVVATLLTPNGDGRNDTWIIRETYFIKDCTVQVFNRWGKKVFEAVNYKNDWNGKYHGKQLPDGAYFYVIKCNDKVKYSGPITIMSTAK